MIVSVLYLGEGFFWKWEGGFVTTFLCCCVWVCVCVCLYGCGMRYLVGSHEFGEYMLTLSGDCVCCSGDKGPSKSAMAYEHYERTVRMLDESMGTCLR